eukprot:2584513-Prymnesium_polylepis.1
MRVALCESNISAHLIGKESAEQALRIAASEHKNSVERTVQDAVQAAGKPDLLAAVVAKAAAEHAQATQHAVDAVLKNADERQTAAVSEALARAAEQHAEATRMAVEKAVQTALMEAEARHDAARKGSEERQREMQQRAEQAYRWAGGLLSPPYATLAR